MSKNKVIALKKPGEISGDPLTELLRAGAQRLIADAVEAELQVLLGQHTALRNGQGHQQVVRNGYIYPNVRFRRESGRLKSGFQRFATKATKGSNSTRRYCRPT